MEPVWALGLMSGTSLDGVDAALVRTDGERVVAFGPSHYRPYTEVERGMLREGMRRAAPLAPDALLAARDAFTAEAEILADVHAEAIAALSAKEGAETPAVIGFHGQTLLHRPDWRFSLQIGDAARLSERTGLPVIHDFRSADLQAGGQGAPFAAFYHYALARRADAVEPLAFLNLGGVGNLTWVDPAADGPEAPGALLAFDTGPANALLNDWVSARAGVSYDEEGRIASRGAADRAIVATEIARPYFAATPPKSLDRDAFEEVADAVSALSVEDGAATLTLFSAAAAAEGARWFPRPAARWLLCGGGRRNPTMTVMLVEELAARAAGGPTPRVSAVEEIGVDGDMLEAQAFAHLAVRSMRGLPLSAPGSTGVPTPTLGGRRVG